MVGVVGGIFVVGGKTGSLYSDDPKPEPEESFGDYLRGAVIGGIILGGLGAVVGGLITNGELTWVERFP